MPVASLAEEGCKVTSHPYLPFCRHIIPTLHLKCFWALFLSILLLLIILYPCNFLSRECGLYKASDLLLGVCEKSDAVNWIDIHDYHLFDYVMLMSSN